MSEEWREGEGEGGMSRFGAFSAIPTVVALCIAVVLAAFIVSVAIAVACEVGWATFGGGK
jgi:hypothetical protein